MRKGIISTVVVGLLLAGSTVDAAPTSRCPDPKTCADYALSEGRWSSSSRGVFIDYRVNPRNAMIPAADVPRMVAAAARTWEVANPRIHFRYRGLTDALPDLEDGMNVVGWSPVALVGVEAARATVRVNDGRITEADMILNATAFSTWQQCAQADNSCGGHTTPDAANTWNAEVQGIVTHEFGHWLSLEHPDSTRGVNLTMVDSLDTNEGMKYQTLGLGDVLGVRAAYPCGTCGGKPVVYAP